MEMGKFARFGVVQKIEFEVKNWWMSI